jgi:hypothetical protein
MAVSKAVKLLDRILDAGYPEGTAKKIATGELPMDEASRLARAVEQGYDPTVTYHHGAKGITEFKAPDEDRFLKFGSGIYSAADPEYGAKYAAQHGMSETQVYPLMSKGNVADWQVLSETQKRLMNDPDYKWRGHDAEWRAIQEDLKSRGFTGADALSERVTFSPNDIRDAERAAFDPANKGLKNILGGSGALAIGLGASDESKASDSRPKISPEMAGRMFDRIVADNTGREKNAYIPVKPTTMDYVQNAGRAIIDYFGTDPGKDMLGDLGQEIAVETALGGLGQMIFGPIGAVGGAAFMPNVAGDPGVDMLNDQGQPMTEAEFAAYRRQLRGN